MIAGAEKRWRRPIHLFWGIVCLLIGAYFGYLAARTIYVIGRSFLVLHVDITTRVWIWYSATLLPTSAAAAFFVWLAARQFHRASGQTAIPLKVRWGRFVLGLYIAFFGAKVHFDPVFSTFRPDSPVQVLTMLVLTLAMLIIGITLMCLAFKPKSSTREMPAETLAR
jgi:RsiW-degrading membrane proteinase PrsW (M82 family)